MISEKRQVELNTLWKRFRFGMTNTTSLYFFPSILGAVVFSTYIGMGNTLELSVAYTITTIFNLIKVGNCVLDFYIIYLVTITLASNIYWACDRIHSIYETYLRFLTLSRDKQISFEKN